MRQNRENRMFYSGTDAKGNKIGIPFGNTLITGNVGTGKSTFIHSIMQDALIHYQPRQIEFRVWASKPDYDIWDVSEMTDGKRAIPNLKIDDSAVGEDHETSMKSLERFLEEIYDVCRARRALLWDYNLSDIWAYNACGDSDTDMTPLVYVIDAWGTSITDKSKKSLQYIAETCECVGVALFWITESTMCTENCIGISFTRYFRNKVAFKTSDENFKATFDVSLAITSDNPYPSNGAYLMLSNRTKITYMYSPRFSYSLCKKIARAISQEVTKDSGD